MKKYRIEYIDLETETIQDIFVIANNVLEAIKQKEYIDGYPYQFRMIFEIGEV